MARIRAMSLHRFLLVVEDLVQFAQRFVARGRKPRCFRRFPAVHFDLGNGVDDIVSCCLRVHDGISLLKKRGP
jgi:hypothetical protein